MSIQYPKQMEGEKVELYVTARSEVDTHSPRLKKALEEYVGIKGIKDVKIMHRYITEGLSQSLVEQILVESPVDRDMSAEDFTRQSQGKHIISFESNPWQFDQRVHALEMIGNIHSKNPIQARYTTMVVIDGDISQEDKTKIEKYLINPQEKRKVDIENRAMRKKMYEKENFETLSWFIETPKTDIKKFIKDFSLAMSIEDLEMVYDYFKDEEKRDPTKSEILAIDTYWSDHCRHTTFNTQLTDVDFSGSSSLIKRAKRVQEIFQKNAKKRKKSGDSFMQLAQSWLSILKNDPKFEGTKVYDENPENNAASYRTIIELENGKREEWIIMFKNETHNSPTEVEPYGGAATCLWGVIRDTLSGRSFTFQAMRVSGSSNPTEPLSATLAGKLSQRAIFLGAAFGYASYGNQIGLPAWQVKEYFHPWYVAKRFECWFVVAWAPSKHIRREPPKKWDIVIMLWKTGRDGVGGAKISSNAQWVATEEQEWAHVQKWNAPEERKLQRLFRNPAFTKYVKKCNDFWAGGIAVAIWEIASGLQVHLDRVPRKYTGLTDDELILSESQERMAIVIEEKDKEAVLELMRQENLEWVHVADVTHDEKDESARMTMEWNGHNVINISRKFLDSAWAQRKMKAKAQLKKVTYFERLDKSLREFLWQKKYKQAILKQLSKLENASQRWLQGIFDNSVVASTILAPYGGKNQSSPQIGMASKVPTFDGVDSLTAVISAHATHPHLLEQNTYVGWVYAVLESISKIVAMGGERKKAWLSLQEYFWKLKTEENWGEVYTMLLWALDAQIELKVAAIWGKDSASGTAVLPDGTTINVPPTIVSFANSVTPSKRIVSAEFKKWGNHILYFPVPKEENGLPIWKKWISHLDTIEQLTESEKVSGSSVIESGGLITALTKMSLGNDIGVRLHKSSFDRSLLEEAPGGIILEVDSETAKKYKEFDIGETTNAPFLNFARDVELVSIKEAQASLENTLEWLFPVQRVSEKIEKIQEFTQRSVMDIIENPTRKPVMLIPVFEWTNSEDDTMHAAKKAGFDVVQYVFRTQTNEEFSTSRTEFAKLLETSDMVVFPGGFSASDEPAGSGKFIVETMKSPEIKDTFNRFLKRKNTLTWGICNGFQALIKLGVFENGEIKDTLSEEVETLYYNDSLVHETGLWKTQVASILSPALSKVNVWDVFVIPNSHGEWNLKISDTRLQQYQAKWQVLFQTLDEEGRPTNKYNGSKKGIAWLTSPDGRIGGMMGHIERRGTFVFKNIPWEKHLPIFEGAFEALTGRPSPSTKK